MHISEDEWIRVFESCGDDANKIAEQIVRRLLTNGPLADNSNLATAIVAIRRQCWADILNAMPATINATDCVLLDNLPKPSGHDKAHVGDIICNTDGQDWFGAHLMRLIHKAHGNFREALRIVFPEHVRLVDEWEKTT